MSQRERLWSGGPGPEDAPEPPDLRPLPKLPGEYAADEEPDPKRRSPWLIALLSGFAGAAVVVATLLVLGVGSSDKPARLPAGRGALGSTQVGAIYSKASRGVVSVAARLGASRSTGTGFLIDRAGTIVTNAHVVGDAGTVEVQFGGQDRTATAGIVSGLGRHITAPNGFDIDEVIQTDAPINPGNSGGPLLDARARVIGVNSQIETGPGLGRGNVGIGFAVPSNAVRDVVPRLAQGKKILH